MHATQGHISPMAEFDARHRAVEEELALKAQSPQLAQNAGTKIQLFLPL